MLGGDEERLVLIVASVDHAITGNTRSEKGTGGKGGSRKRCGGQTIRLMAVKNNISKRFIKSAHR